MQVTHWPPYMSNLVFELWRRPSDGEHYVKVRLPQSRWIITSRFGQRVGGDCKEQEGGFLGSCQAGVDVKGGR